jgi:hypothetical protein
LHFFAIFSYVATERRERDALTGMETAAAQRLCQKKAIADFLWNHSKSSRTFSR